MIVFFSDEHFGKKNSDKKVFENYITFFENQVFPYILENDITEVCSLGDIVDDRAKIDLFIQQELKERFFGWFEKNKVNIHLIVSNHSIYFKDRITHHFFKNNFEGYDYVHYYDETSVVPIGGYTFGFVPWQTKESELVLPKCDIILGHFDIIGAKLNSQAVSKKGYEVNQFKNYRLVLSGHYHSPSEISNIKYLGTPYQMDWSNCGEDHGFYVLGDNYELEFIENKISPKFIKVVYSEDEIELIGA